MTIRHQRVLSDEQIRDYHETGYLNIRQILDPALLARLIATTERLYDAVSYTHLTLPTKRIV